MVQKARGEEQAGGSATESIPAHKYKIYNKTNNSRIRKERGREIEREIYNKMMDDKYIIISLRRHP